MCIRDRDNDMGLAIETKHPVPQGSLVEKKVLELLEQEELETDVVLMSFSWLAIENIRRINPQQKTVALLHERLNYVMQRFTSAPILGPSVGLLRSNPELAHAIKPLYVWTVDDGDDMRFCLENGVEVLSLIHI